MEDNGIIIKNGRKMICPEKCNQKACPHYEKHNEVPNCAAPCGEGNGCGAI